MLPLILVIDAVSIISEKRACSNLNAVARKCLKRGLCLDACVDWLLTAGPGAQLTPPAQVRDVCACTRKVRSIRQEADPSTRLLPRATASPARPARKAGLRSTRTTLSLPTPPRDRGHTADRADTPRRHVQRPLAGTRPAALWSNTHPLASASRTSATTPPTATARVAIIVPSQGVRPPTSRRAPWRRMTTTHTATMACHHPVDTVTDMFLGHHSMAMVATRPV